MKDKDIMDKMFNKDEEIGCLLEIFYSILQLHYRLLNKKRPPQFLEAAPIRKNNKTSNYIVNSFSKASYSALFNFQYMFNKYCPHNCLLSGLSSLAFS